MKQCNGYAMVFPGCTGCLFHRYSFFRSGVNNNMEGGSCQTRAGAVIPYVFSKESAVEFVESGLYKVEGQAGSAGG